jgi:hypothetical protein
MKITKLIAAVTLVIVPNVFWAQHYGSVHFDPKSIDSLLKTKGCENVFLQTYLNKDEFFGSEFKEKYLSVYGLNIYSDNKDEEDLILGFKDKEMFINAKKINSGLGFVKAFPNIENLIIQFPNKFNINEILSQKNIKDISISRNYTDYNKELEFKDNSHLNNLTLDNFDIDILPKLLTGADLKKLELSFPLKIQNKFISPNDLSYLIDSSFKNSDSLIAIDFATMEEVFSLIPKGTKINTLSIKYFDFDKREPFITLPELDIPNLEALTILGYYNYYDLNQVLKKCKKLKEVYFINSFPDVKKSKTRIPIVNILYKGHHHKDTLNKIEIEKTYFNDLVKNKGVKVLILRMEFEGFVTQFKMPNSKFSMDFLMDESFEAFYIESYEGKQLFYNLFGDTTSISKKVHFTPLNISDEWLRFPQTISGFCDYGKNLIECNPKQEETWFGGYDARLNISDVEFIRPYIKYRAPEWLQQFDKRDFFLFGNSNREKDISYLEVQQLDTLYEINKSGDTIISRVYNESVMKELNSLKSLSQLYLFLKYDGWEPPTLDSLKNLKLVWLDAARNKKLSTRYLYSLNSEQLKKINLDSTYDLHDRFNLFEKTNDTGTLIFLNSLKNNTKLNALNLDAPLTDFSTLNQFKELKRIKLGKNVLQDTSYKFNISNDLDYLGVTIDYTTNELLDKLSKSKMIELRIDEFNKQYLSRKPEFGLDAAVNDIAKIVYKRTNGKQELFFDEINNISNSGSTFSDELIEKIMNVLVKMN